MNEQIKEYLDKYPRDIIDMYYTFRKLIFDSVSSQPQETMWAKLPTYYVGESFVRLIYYYAIGEDGTAEELDFVGYDWDDYEEKRPEVAALEEKHPRREGLEFDWIKIEK